MALPSSHLRPCPAEVMRPDEQAALPADVFSFAMCCWELMTCRRPYADQRLHPLAIYYRVCHDGLREHLPTTGAVVAAGLADLAVKCWAESPGDRPQFPRVLDTLDDALRQLGADNPADRPWVSATPAVVGESDRGSAPESTLVTLAAATTVSPSRRIMSLPPLGEAKPGGARNGLGAGTRPLPALAARPGSPSRNPQS